MRFMCEITIFCVQSLEERLGVVRELEGAKALLNELNAEQNVT